MKLGANTAPNRDAIIRVVAARNHGVFSRDEALSAGFSPAAIGRRLRSGEWEVPLPRVYRVAGAPSTWIQKVSAAHRWAEPKGVVSHRTAAALYELDGFEEGVIEVTTPRRLRSPHRDLVVHQTDRLEGGDVILLRGIGTTHINRTLIDLCAVVEPEALEIALDCALRRRLLSLARLELKLRTYGSGRRGSGVLREILVARGRFSRPADSPFETLLRRYLRRYRLPQPVAQHSVYESGREIYRFDFAYPERMIAIEAVSLKHHFGVSAWKHDHKRRRYLVARGWRIYEIIYEEMKTKPDIVFSELARLLGVEKLVF